MRLLRCDKPYNLDEVRKAKGKPLIGPLMTDEAMRFLEAVLKLPLSWVKLSFLALFCTGIRPEEMQALMPGSFLFTGPEPATRITSAVKRGGVKIEDYPKPGGGPSPTTRSWPTRPRNGSQSSRR